LIEIKGLEPYKYEVVKRGITIAMDKHDKERELVSRLISELYLNGLSRSEIALGLRRVLLQANELQIDIPK
jgi:programmed cell death protein 4